MRGEAYNIASLRYSLAATTQSQVPSCTTPPFRFSLKDRNAILCPKGESSRKLTPLATSLTEATISSSVSTPVATSTIATTTASTTTITPVRSTLALAFSKTKNSLPDDSLYSVGTVPILGNEDKSVFNNFGDPCVSATEAVTRSNIRAVSMQQRPRETVTAGLFHNMLHPVRHFDILSRNNVRSSVMPSGVKEDLVPHVSVATCDKLEPCLQAKQQNLNPNHHCNIKFSETTLTPSVISIHLPKPSMQNMACKEATSNQEPSSKMSLGIISEDRINTCSKSNGKTQLVSSISAKNNFNEGTPAVLKANRVVIANHGVHTTSTDSSTGQQNLDCHQSEKWIIRRELASNLHGTGYGERNNVWTQNSAKCYSTADDHFPRVEHDLVANGEDMSNRCNEGTRYGVDIQTSANTDTDSDSKKANVSPSSLAVSQRKKPKHSSTVSNSLSLDWLSKNLQTFNKEISNDRFRENRFLGNKLISKEMHRNHRIYRELIYQKTPRIQESLKKKTGSSNASKSSRKGYHLSLRPVAQNQSEPTNLSTKSPDEELYEIQRVALDSQSSTIYSSSSSSSSSISDILAKSSTSLTERDVDSMVQIKEIPGRNSRSNSTEEHKSGKLKSRVRVREVEYACDDKQKAPLSKTRFRGVSKKELGCQELLDYFWSYQGISRQVLGIGTPNISLQSAVWEQEKITARESDWSDHKDQRKQLNYGYPFSHFNRLPPIHITDHVVPIFINGNLSNCLPEEFDFRASHERQSLLVNQEGRKRMEITHRDENCGTSHCQGKRNPEALDLELQQRRGRNKLCLVVKLPHQQTSDDEE